MCRKYSKSCLPPPPQNPIILVPKVSPSEKLTKNFNVRYRAKPAKVYVVAVLSERLPKKMFLLKNHASNASNDLVFQYFSLVWTKI